jgi:hypothetical protein
MYPSQAIGVETVRCISIVALIFSHAMNSHSMLRQRVYLFSILLCKFLVNYYKDLRVALPKAAEERSLLSSVCLADASRLAEECNYIQSHQASHIALCG